MTIRRHASAREFLDRAEEWLLEREAEHNVILGLTERMSRDSSLFRDPIYLATIELEERVVGCAFRTPPHKLGLTRLPESEIPALAADVFGVYDSLPGVLGGAREAEAFATEWTARHGGSFDVAQRLGIHSLERVVHTPADVPGSIRAGTLDDLSLAVEWAVAFARETGDTLHAPRERTEQLIREGSLFIWDDGGPRTMAATVARTPNGARIGYVYTPESARRRGYATALVSALSDKLLGDGRRVCFLYTDLANPTSNAIYERIGYRKVCDVVDLDLS